MRQLFTPAEQCSRHICLSRKVAFVIGPISRKKLTYVPLATLTWLVVDVVIELGLGC